MNDKQAKLGSVNARIEKSTSRSESLPEEGQVLSRELAENDRSRGIREGWRA